MLSALLHNCCPSNEIWTGKLVGGWFGLSVFDSGIRNGAWIVPSNATALQWHMADSEKQTNKQKEKLLHCFSSARNLPLGAFQG